MTKRSSGAKLRVLAGEVWTVTFLLLFGVLIYSDAVGRGVPSWLAPAVIAGIALGAAFHVASGGRD